MIGVHGKPVQLVVEEDTKTERDYATARCRNLKEKIVQLMEHCDMRFRNAMKIRVQVNRKLLQSFIINYKK